MYMLWIKDGPASRYSQQFPAHARKTDKWWAVLVPNANGGVEKFPTVDAAAHLGMYMLRDYLDFAVTPWRHDMAYHDAAPANAIEWQRPAVA